ncbi:MAG: hypothetical protein WCG01_04395 [bacterium]
MNQNLPSYKQAAISIAILTIIFTAGMTDGYRCCARRSKQSAEMKRERVMSSIEGADFDQWRQSVGPEYVMLSDIAKEDFREFVIARKLARSGRYEKSIILANKLKIKFDKYFA